MWHHGGHIISAMVAGYIDDWLHLLATLPPTVPLHLMGQSDFHITINIQINSATWKPSIYCPYPRWHSTSKYCGFMHLNYRSLAVNSQDLIMYQISPEWRQNDVNQTLLSTLWLHPAMDSHTRQSPLPGSFSFQQFQMFLSRNLPTHNSLCIWFLLSCQSTYYSAVIPDSLLPGHDATLLTCSSFSPISTQYINQPTFTCSYQIV